MTVAVGFQLERQFAITRVLISLFFQSAFVATVFGALSGPARGQPTFEASSIRFDIPSQPLADALVAFGVVTGLEVFYDGALAIGRRSTGVSGTLTPAVALRKLLAGTDCVAVATGDPSTLMIVQATSITRPSAAASSEQFRVYEPYFATLQSRVDYALCGNNQTDSRQIILSLWLAPSGVISRTEVVGADRNSTQYKAIARGLTGLEVGKALPPGLPQPITMVIFPPATGETAECSPHGRAASN